MQALEYFSPKDFNQEFEITPGIKVQFRYAGHILGAASAIFRAGSQTIGFSGDIGRQIDRARDSESDTGIEQACAGIRCCDCQGIVAWRRWRATDGNASTAVVRGSQPCGQACNAGRMGRIIRHQGRRCMEKRVLHGRAEIVLRLNNQRPEFADSGHLLNPCRHFN